MTEFDSNGVSIPGTYAISTVSIGMWKSDGTPFPTVESAVCDLCDGWASNVWTAGVVNVVDRENLGDVRVRRTLRVIVYACPEHSDQVVDALVDEYGSAGNAIDVDTLAQRVDQHQRRS